MAKIYLLDGNYLAYRSFYAIPHLQSSSGKPVGALYGFASTIIKILKDYQALYLGVAFDMKAPTFRHHLFDHYKITRKPMPELLVEQLPEIRNILDAFGIPIIEKEGYEADDLLASMALDYAAQGYESIIVTGDKDLAQVLGKGISLLNPATWKSLDRQSFLKKYGFSSEHIVDFLALTGDASDNIPGVPGIGEKTATALISTFGSLDELYSRLNELDSARIKRLLEEGRDSAFFSKKLLLLARVEVPYFCEDLRISSTNLASIESLFTSFEFHSLLPSVRDLFSSGEAEEELFAIGSEEIPFSKIAQSPLSYKALLEDPSISKTGSSIKEKIHFFSSNSIILQGPTFDIDIASSLLSSPVPRFSLCKARKTLEESLRREGVERLFFEIENPLPPVLASMESQGIRIDLDYCQKLSEDFASQIRVLEEKIFALAGEKINLNSPLQVSKILFERLLLPAGKKRKQGYSTDSATLEGLRHLHPIIPLILEYREIAKLKSSHLDSLLSFVNPATGRIHPHFSQTVTTSGRLSCSKPNLQTIPARTDRGSLVRKMFIANSDASFYSFDYNQIELRLLAHFSKDPLLLETFSQGADIHLETARLLFPEKFSGLFSDSQDSLRRIAKTINFGILYGMGAYGLSTQLGISREEAQSFIDAYFARLPGVRAYLAESIRLAQERGYATTLFGRRRYLPDLSSDRRSIREAAERIAINMPLQGTAAEIIKKAMIEIFTLFKEEGVSGAMLLQIHDELLFELPEKEEYLLPRISDIMENIYPFQVPLIVKSEKGSNYLEMKGIPE